MKRTCALLVISLATVMTIVPGSASGGRAQPAPSKRGGVVTENLGPAIGRSPRGAARAALERAATRLGVDSSDLRFDSVRRSIVGVHVRGREYRNGVPVEGTSAVVHIVDGSIWQVEVKVLPHLPGEPDEDPIDAAAAIGAAATELGVTRTIAPPSAERLLVTRGDGLVDVWRVSLLSSGPALAATVDVDTSSGRVLTVRDARVSEAPTATVFDPNPIVTSRNKGLRQPGVDQAGVDTDIDSEELTGALVELPLKDLDTASLPAGRLQGPWADVQGPAPLASVDGNFAFTRSDPRFEATMAYAHIDRLQRYFSSLGFEGDAGANNEPQNVYALPVIGFDNSFYQPGNDIIVLGAGGVDDGEDAEVIVHEYGHAVQDAQVPGWGQTAEGGAMGEGFGDFLAGAFYARSSKGFQDECIAEWDATSYSDEDPTCLRRLDSPKIYPDDIENEVHADGEIWSAFLWRLRDRLVLRRSASKMGTGELAKARSDAALTLVLASHEFLSPTAEFSDAVAALRTAARALGHSEWIGLVNKAAAETGLPH
jgi:hypothetical protein